MNDLDKIIHCPSEILTSPYTVKFSFTVQTAIPIIRNLCKDDPFVIKPRVSSLVCALFFLFLFLFFFLPFSFFLFFCGEGEGEEM